MLCPLCLVKMSVYKAGSEFEEDRQMCAEPVRSSKPPSGHVGPLLLLLLVTQVQTQLAALATPILSLRQRGFPCPVKRENP